MHHLGSSIKIDQLDVTCFIISLFTAQHVSNVSTSIFRSLRPIVNLFHVLYCSGSMCVGVTVWFGWVGVVSVTPTHIEPEQYNTWNKFTIGRKLLKMDVLTFETCWAVNSEIIKQVTSSWSIFIQQFYNYFLVISVKLWDPTEQNKKDQFISITLNLLVYIVWQPEDSQLWW